ncbi:hypothetical protein ACHAPM_009759 [Fusarium culmorum]
MTQGAANTSNGRMGTFTQDNFGGGERGEVSNPRALRDVLRTAARTGVTDVRYNIEPLIGQDFMHVITNEGVLTTSGLHRFKRPLQSQAEDLPEQCSHCKRAGHSLKDCLYGLDGVIPGCIFFNLQDHAVDACADFKAMSLRDKVRLLVHDRSKRPALKTSIDWWDYLRDYLKQEGTDIPEAFPWSSDFAIAKANRDRGVYILGLQVLWDEKRNLDDLPMDPKHGSREDVVRLYVGTHFWPTQPSRSQRA